LDTKSDTNQSTFDKVQDYIGDGFSINWKLSEKMVITLLGGAAFNGLSPKKYRKRLISFLTGSTG